MTNSPHWSFPAARKVAVILNSGEPGGISYKNFGKFTSDNLSFHAPCLSSIALPCHNLYHADQQGRSLAGKSYGLIAARVTARFVRMRRSTQVEESVAFFPYPLFPGTPRAIAPLLLETSLRQVGF
jgi:hypothetical protein